MADYFIATTGSDSTGAGTAVNPWKTFGKAIGSGKAIGATLSTPTRLVVEPGIYREQPKVEVSPSASAPLTIRGDFDGSLFAAGGKANPKTGLVDIRGWTDDWTSMPSGTKYETLDISGKSHVTLERIRVIAGNSDYPYALIADGCDDITVRDCVFVGAYAGTQYAQSVVYFGAPAASPVTLLMERCVVVGVGLQNVAPLVIKASRAVAATLACDIKIRACLIFGGVNGFVFGTNGGSGLPPSGLTVQNCTIQATSGSGIAIHVGEAALAAPAATIRDTIVLVNNGVAINAGHVSHVNENYNLLNATSPRGNTAVGANTKVMTAPALDWLAAVASGGPNRPFLEPDATSPAIGWGSHGSTPTADLLGREWSANPACGALERVDPAPTGSGRFPHYLIA